MHHIITCMYTHTVTVSHTHREREREPERQAIHVVGAPMPAHVAAREGVMI